MGISEQIADARHWVTEHKLKAIGTFALLNKAIEAKVAVPEQCVHGRWAVGNRSGRVFGIPMVEANPNPDENHPLPCVFSGKHVILHDWANSASSKHHG